MSGIFQTLHVAQSALSAERLRMEVASSNLANAETTRTAEGGAYVPRSVVFRTVALGGDAGAPGVEVSAIVPQGAAPKVVHDPTHPDADAAGYVTYPGVDVAAEMVDLMGASRSYQIQGTVAASAKATALDAIDLGRA